MQRTLLAISLLLFPCLANAQATVPAYAFTDMAVDAAVNATTNPNYSVQATLGQTFTTVDPPSDSGQTLVYYGFAETFVPYTYLAQVTLDSYIGNANPGVTYGVITNIPFTAETFNTGSVGEGVLPGTAFFADATGKVKVLSSMNPAFAQSLSVKGPLWLRQNGMLTPPADPVNGYPSASFTLPGGDSNGDNGVDISDFGALVNAYSSLVTAPASGYDPNADFNQDGTVDISDFGILVNNYGLIGDP